MTRKATQSSQSAKNKKSPDPSVTQLTAIRDLLFGEQIARLEKTIEEQRQFFSDQLAHLESQFKQSNERIENQIQSAIVELNQSIDNIHNEHISQEGILEDKLSYIGKSLDEFQSQTEHEFGTTHTELDNAAKEIYNSIEKEVKTLSKKIDKTSKELSSNKADRKTLANLLESMASNLNQSQA